MSLFVTGIGLGECFARNPSLLEFFGEDLPYLRDEVRSSELRASLGIADSLTVDVLLSRLTQLAPAIASYMPIDSVVSKSNLRTAERIYAFLNLRCGDHEAAVKIHQSFINSQPSCFHRPYP